MQSTIVSVRELAAADRWKAELFLSTLQEALIGSFPMRSVASMASERREFIEPSNFASHPFTYLGLENIESVSGDFVGNLSRAGADVKSRSKVFRVGDVLYGRLRPNLNKVAWVDAWLGDGICSGEFYVLQPDTSIVLPGFLRYLLASPPVSARLANLHTGSALPRLQIDDLWAVDLPSPPLDLQLQVVELIRAYENDRRLVKARLARGPSLIAERLDQLLVAGESEAVPGLSELFADLTAPKLPSHSLPECASDAPRTRSSSKARQPDQLRPR